MAIILRPPQIDISGGVTFKFGNVAHIRGHNREDGCVDKLAGRL